MSDLDDEELEATRKLNGVAKKNDIEKDIKRCEQLIKPEHANWIGISNQLAIAHLIERIKELEEETTDLKQALARNIAKNFTSSMKESAKAKEDLEMLNKGWQIELEKKDKIIYEMIDAFIDLGFGFEYCNNDDRCINDCDKCIKQYFERKSKK